MVLNFEFRPRDSNNLLFAALPVRVVGLVEPDDERVTFDNRGTPLPLRPSNVPTQGTEPNWLIVHGMGENSK